MKQLKNFTLTCFLLCIFSNLNSQELSKHKLKYGVGYGFSNSENSTGAGSLLLIGYEYDFANDRLHLNPNFTTGKFSTKYILDAGDQWFNSMNFNTALYFDLIKFKTFSCVIGAGAFINNTQGYLAASGWNSTSAEFINLWHVGVYAGAGFRFNPQKGRIAFELMPVNIHYMPSNGEPQGKRLIEIYPTLGLSVRL